MRLIILLLTALWLDSPSFGHIQADIQSNVRNIPKRFTKITKRQEDLGYLEQCSILQFWDKQIGRVNVLAFFDSTWQFSHRQAAMLRILRERFDKTGFDNIQFFAINAAAGESRYIDKSEIEVEEETWKQISPSEAEGQPPVVVSPEALIEALGPDVYFIQDNEELQIWSKLRAFRDQILVIDRCGRLTYQVIVPWSILHFPYVKAAILSTYKDEPCGHCQFQESPFDTTTNENDTPSTFYEDSTITIQTENVNVPSMSEEPSTIPEESSTTRMQIDNYTSSMPDPEESSTLLIQMTENNDVITSTEESLMKTTETDNNDTPSVSEELALNIQTESNPTFDTTKNLYDTTSSEKNSEFLNFTKDEYTDDYLNATTTTDPDSTTESLETLIIEITDKLDDNNNTTEQYSETELPTTTEISNASTETDEPRLKDSEEIESLDARDVLKSRSTNARSVSPNDGSENHLEIIEINGEAINENQNSLESDYLIPIRIIMRAPHVDEYSDRSMKAHEYLVLKTGEPDYHEHLEAPHIDEESRHEPHSIRKKSEAIKRTFGKDESPGLYGEVADYWRNFGNEQIGNTQSSSEEDDEDDQVLEQDTNYNEEDMVSTPTTLSQDIGRGNTEYPYERPAIIPVQEIELDSGKVYEHESDFNEDVDIVDEEAKSKLIAHYSKLLPWLYYVLAK